MWTWIVVALLAVNPLRVQNAAPDKQQQEAYQVPSSPFSMQPQPAAGPEQQSPTNEPNHPSFDWLWRPLRDNWPLVAVAIWGILVALRTLDTIRKQTDATVKAANAASKSADALVCAERPWLVLTIKRPFKLDQRARVDWFIKNTGRSTARILEGKFRCRKYRGTEKLPDIPDYGEPINFYSVPVPPDNSLEAWCYMEPAERDYRRLTSTEIGEIREKGHELIAYGYVRYLDTFGLEPHESRCCYYFATFCEGFRMNLNAPSEYHKST
jgi:hypothetical protein